VQRDPPPHDQRAARRGESEEGRDRLGSKQQDHPTEAGGDPVELEAASEKGHAISLRIHHPPPLQEVRCSGIAPWRTPAAMVREGGSQINYPGGNGARPGLPRMTPCEPPDVPCDPGPPPPPAPLDDCSERGGRRGG